MSVYFLEPCLDHISTMMGRFLAGATFRQARSIKLSSLCHHDLRPMTMKFVLFGTMPIPCFDHVRIMFGLALLPDQLEV